MTEEINEETGFVKKARRDFDIDIERRMRTAIFVKKLYERKGIMMSETEALEKLRDPAFLVKMIETMFSVEDQLTKPLDLQENPEETIDKLAEMFFSMEEEE